MATFAANTLWEIQTTGSDANNGGSFNPANASMDNTMQCIFNSALSNTPIISGTGYSFVSTDLGHWWFLKSGTHALPGWYQIIGISGNAAIINAYPGSGLLYNSVWGGPYLYTNRPGISNDGTISLSSLTWSIDYSQNTPISLSTLTSVGAGSTFISASIGKNCVGNMVNVLSGTNFTPGRYQILSTAGTTATVNSADTVGVGALGVANMGGQLLSLGLAAATGVGGNMYYAKTGFYTLTDNRTNISGGCPSFLGGNPGGLIQGYGILRGDGGNPPTISAGSLTGITIITMSSSFAKLENFIINGSSGINLGVKFGQNRQMGSYLIVQDCWNSGIFGSTTSQAYRCIVTGCSGIGIAGTLNIVECEANNNFGPGFSAQSIVESISSNNIGSNADGAVFTTLNTICSNNIFYNNGRYGINANQGGMIFSNNIVENNKVGGFSLSSSLASTNILNKNAVYNNAGQDLIATPNSGTFIYGTGTFFVDAPNGNFALNNLPNQGALLRAAGTVGLMPRGLTMGYGDIGVAQHQDQGGGTVINNSIFFPNITLDGNLQ